MALLIPRLTKHLSMESSSRVCVPEQWKGAVPSCQSGHLTPPGPEEPGCAGTTCPSAGVGGSFTQVRVSSTHLRAALLKQLSSPPPLLLSVSAPVRLSVPAAARSPAPCPGGGRRQAAPQSLLPGEMRKAGSSPAPPCRRGPSVGPAEPVTHSLTCYS